MPIKPENKKLYPSNWSDIREKIKARAGNKCELCGVQNHAVGVRHPETKAFYEVGTGMAARYILAGEKVIKIVCTVMHLDHKPQNCADENLKFGCQRCHNKYDSAHRRANAAKTRLAAKS